ncbi:MAG: YbaK/prolyl-tRNA synthetase associated region [Polaromonas sp.]|nr:YbaK/prolyl-tRNA synthetase associated region [Polaromonas sp.]
MCGAELTVLPEGVQRVAALLQNLGHPHMPVMLDDAARTAQEAADALGVALGQIAKSIVFRRRADEVAVVVITSGDQRVDERKLEPLVCPDGKRLGRADAAFVKSRTGFTIGGVSPVAHVTDTVVLVDRSLFRFDAIWAAAGHPHAVFQLAPQDLQRLTGAAVTDLAVNVDAEKLLLQRAAALVALRAGSLDLDSSVPSPCNSVCRMNGVTGWCEGCFRTRDEIAAWGMQDEPGKRAVWTLIGERAAALGA